MLLIAVLAIIGIRFMVPETDVAITVTPVDIAGYSRDTSPFTTKGTYIVQKEASYKPSVQKRTIDINDCDSSLLVTLPGIGPVLSSRIIKYRNLLGGYVSVSQLREVYGLPDETFEMILPLITVLSQDVHKIQINKAGFKELLRHPYLEKSEVSAILKYRELKGTIGDVNDLIDHKLITEERALKILPYLEYDK